VASFNTLIVEQAAQRGEQTFVFDTTTSLTVVEGLGGCVENPAVLIHARTLPRLLHSTYLLV